MVKLRQPGNGHRHRVLQQVGAHMQSPHFGAAFKLAPERERTGIAESFEIVTLDPADLGPVAENQLDLGDVLRPTQRWHHQMLVGGLPAYAESWDDEPQAPLGTLVTDTRLSVRIDKAWSAVAQSADTDDDVQLLRVPKNALVAFVARATAKPSRCWIVDLQSSDAALVGRWLAGAEFAQALLQLEPVTGFIAEHAHLQSR